MILQYWPYRSASISTEGTTVTLPREFFQSWIDDWHAAVGSKPSNHACYKFFDADCCTRYMQVSDDFVCFGSELIEGNW